VQVLQEAVDNEEHGFAIVIQEHVDSHLNNVTETDGNFRL